MRTTLLATAVAAALTLAAVEASAAPGSAATKAEIQAMQAQMEALAARLGMDADEIDTLVESGVVAT